MARRKRRRSASPFRVTRVPVEVALRLATVSPSDPEWRGAEPDDAAAFVRLFPPHDASDEDVRRVEDAYRGAGAIGVSTKPRASAPQSVVGEEGRTDDPFDLDEEAPDVGDMREAVEASLSALKGDAEHVARVRRCAEKSLSEAGV